jgi:hypothetical protein
MRFSACLAGALLAFVTPALAQTAIKPRVILMVDTSGSMVSHLSDNNPTFGDGSSSYKDASITNNSYYEGVQVGSLNCGGAGCSLSGTCPAAGPFDGVNSRMFAAKQAITNVLNGSGDIDWGLMRYTGTACTAVANPFTKTACTKANQCTSNVCTGGFCACSTDLNCNFNEICVAGSCGVDANFACNPGANPLGNNYAEIINNAGSCNFRGLGITYAGSCGTGGSAGAAGCATAQTCYADSDCSGTLAGRCALVGTGPVRTCQCNVAGATCPTGYTCGAGNRCVYNLGCQTAGGFILSDPATQASSAVFPYVNNVEDYTPNAGGPSGVNDPELRADGLTPLAGAARTATTWYNAIKNANSDTQIACRPYVLVQITDGFDTCDADATNGPVAAAQSFVAATAANARVLNKVYVIGLAFGGASSTSLDQIAAAGGTAKARLANSATDIEAALADIVSSSVLVEKCNNADDDCNGACDEPFPDVLVNGAGCSNPHAAKTCNNGQLPGTHCFATGTFVCSADQLSEVCNSPTCASMASLCPTAETCNGQDDDCNGVVDDCTPFVPNSCCTGKCPACNPTGVPQPETCNGCDDDCDGTADNHLTDTGVACGSNVGDCSQGTTFCCQQVSPTTGTCTTDPVSTSVVAPVHTNPDKLFCLGGVGPAAQMCDGTDHDCDGVIDPASKSCFPFATGMAGVGICKAGTQVCTAAPCGTAPNACCPAGWPVGKPCPGAAMFGACSGAVGPQTEVCNGIDDDCNGTVDNNITDPWAGTPCCPTGNNADCTNTGTGTRCKLGAYQCVGGMKTCVGGVAKSPETCNNVDDDCNGPIDDNIAGNGQPCTGGGTNTTPPCTAHYTCGPTKPGAGPNGLTCTQVVGPTPEICNGIDDNCDGTIDNNLMDPRVGVTGGTPCTPLTPLPGTMFPAGGPQPPCMPGITACVNGSVVCQGEVTPQPNQCGGLSTDCTGNTNSVTCPSGFQCVQGNCVAACSGGEFPCPGGFVCDQATMLCIPDKCAQKNCPAGFLCSIDSSGNASCVDPCTKINCGTGFQCVNGSCVDCHQLGCPSGQICVGTPGQCQNDPCTGVMCPANQYCDTTGNCVAMCTTCPPHEICINGGCQMDPCEGMQCNADEVCTLQGTPPTGVCVPSMCGDGCVSGQVCCGGSCRIDQCGLLQCPSGSQCALGSSCEPTCIPLPPADNVVGAGGGGGACSTVPGSQPKGTGLAFALLLGIALLLARRGRRSV